MPAQRFHVTPVFVYMHIPLLCSQVCVYRSLCICVLLSGYISCVYQYHSICVPVLVSTTCVPLFVCQYECVPVFMCTRICLYQYLCVPVPMRTSVYAYQYLCVPLFVYQYPHVPLFMCTSICLCTSVHIYQQCVGLCHFLPYLPVYIYPCHSPSQLVHVSVYCCICIIPYTHICTSAIAGAYLCISVCKSSAYRAYLYKGCVCACVSACVCQCVSNKSPY